MSFNVAALIDEIRNGARDLPRTKALEYVQTVADELNEELRLTQDTSDIPFVANQAAYALDTTITKVYSAVPMLALSILDPLEQVSIREEELDRPGFKSAIPLSQTSTTPDRIYESVTATGARALGLAPIPSSSTLVVSGATNASPIVVTTTVAHGLTDGAAVLVSGVLGNLAANGNYYAKVTSYSTTTFALYTDGALTIPVVGNGAYVSGGIIATVAVGFVRLYVAKTQAYTDASNSLLPASVTSLNAYKEYAWFQWATANHKDEAPTHWANFLLAKSILKRRKTNFLIDVKPKARPYLRQQNAAL